MSKKPLTQPLAAITAREVTAMGYVIGDGFKTHSSFFYNLHKNNQDYLLKLDQNQSGSLLHQVIYSDIQKSLGIPYIPVAFCDEAGRYMIIEKLDSFADLKKVINQNLMQMWGRDLGKIHAHTPQGGCSTWVGDYGEFMFGDHDDVVDEYLELAQTRFDNLSSDQESRVGLMIDFITAHKSKYIDDSVLVHGDLHTNNVMVCDGLPLIYDPNGIVLAGSRYIDLAIVALDYPGYFVDSVENYKDDALYFAAFLEGYGEIDTQKLYYYMLLRGVERYGFSSIIKHVDTVTDYIFTKLAG